MPVPLKPQKKSFTVYFGGPLFDVKQLVGNAYLAEAVYEKSHGQYLCQLPQDHTRVSESPQARRDRAIRDLYASDLAVFNFDGAELDGGVVVEFMLAKTADIPCVLLRTDVRRGGDQGGDARDPWTLMASYYPRTVTVRTPSLPDYRKLQAKRLKSVRTDVVRLAGQHASATASLVCDALAVRIVRALDRVRSQPPHLPRHLREEIYQWLALLPALRGKPKALRKELEHALERKVKKELL